MVIKSSFYLLVERVLNAASSFLTLTLAANLLDTSDFGLYSYNVAVYSISAPLIFFGLNGLLVRRFLDSTRTASVIVNAAIIRLVSFIFIALALYGATFLNGKISIILVLALFGGIFQTFESYNQAFENNKLTMNVRVLISIVFLGVKFGLLSGNSGSVDTLILVFSSELAAYFIVGFFSSIQINLSLSLIRISEIKYMISGGIFLVASGFAEVINLRIDQIMVAEIVGVEKGGQYAIAARMIEFPVMFAAVIAAAYFPKFYTSSIRKDRLYQNLRKLNLFMLLASSAAIIILYLIGPLIINIFFGAQYSSSAQAMVYLLPCIYMLFFRVVISKWILATGLYWYSLYSHAIGAITNIFLNYFFIPEWGVNGAVAASLISYFSACWIALLINPNTRSYLRHAYFK